MYTRHGRYLVTGCSLHHHARLVCTWTPLQHEAYPVSIILTAWLAIACSAQRVHQGWRAWGLGAAHQYHMLYYYRHQPPAADSSSCTCDSTTPSQNSSFWHTSFGHICVHASRAEQWHRSRNMQRGAGSPLVRHAVHNCVPSARNPTPSSHK